ncbi:MAG: AAA family ATPase [Bacteroidia bacterium]|nr:AAA family ATPase [Bacteroidia bacterium]
MYSRKLLDKLLIWRDNPVRKPLIIRGARQVGKTTLIKMFSQNYNHFILLNLEKKSDLEIFEKSDDIRTIIQTIYLIFIS